MVYGRVLSSIHSTGTQSPTYLKDTMKANNKVGSLQFRWPCTGAVYKATPPETRLNHHPTDRNNSSLALRSYRAPADYVIIDASTQGVDGF